MSDDRVTKMLIGFGGPDVLGEATKDVWRILTENPDAFLEASISRIYQHWQEHEFGLITAWRQYEDDCATPRSGDVNGQNMAGLLNMISASNLDHIRLVGHGTEDDMPVEEPSYMVVNQTRDGEALDNFRDLLVDWASQAAWVQDSIIYHHPQAGSELIQVSECAADPDNPAALRRQPIPARTLEIFPGFVPAVREYYSQRKKRWQQDVARQKLGEPPEQHGVFALEFLRYGDEPHTWLEGMGRGAMGDLGFKPRVYASRANQTALVIQEMCKKSLDTEPSGD